MQEFKFDYDKENDDLFLYSTKTKTTASVEIGDVVLDFDKNKGLSGIEIMNATKFLNSLISDDRILIDKDTLANLIACRVASKVQNNFLFIKLLLLIKHKQKIPVNLSVPRISKSSPALSSS